MDWLNGFLADTETLLQVGFVQSAIIAAALLGLVSGVITPLVVMRRMSFTVHGTSELALMGASAALLTGFSVGGGAIVGSVLAAVVLALLGMRGGQDTIVGVVLSFGMGLSVLFIHLYPGRTTTAFSLLTGQIVGLSSASVWLLAGVADTVPAVNRRVPRAAPISVDLPTPFGPSTARNSPGRTSRSRSDHSGATAAPAKVSGVNYSCSKSSRMRSYRSKKLSLAPGDS